MVNGLYVCSTFLVFQLLKALLQHKSAFTHSHTHSHTNSKVAFIQRGNSNTHIGSNLGFSILPNYTWTCRPEESGKTTRSTYWATATPVGNYNIIDLTQFHIRFNSVSLNILIHEGQNLVFSFARTGHLLGYYIKYIVFLKRLLLPLLDLWDALPSFLTVFWL